MPTPRPGVGEVVVTTLFSGISGGTERLIYRGEFPQGLALDDTIDANGVPSATPFLRLCLCLRRRSRGLGPAGLRLQPHQDVFTARPGDMISLPAVDPASATLFPLVETALQASASCSPMPMMVCVQVVDSCCWRSRGCPSVW
jgi:hypothetical protein